MTGEEILDRLEAALGHVERRLQDRIDINLADFPLVYGPMKLTPFDMQDNNGRYILLDALSALAVAKATLGGNHPTKEL